MPIDTSVYSQLQAPDIAGSIDKGLRLRDLVDARNEKSAIKDAYKSNMQTASDGTMSLNRPKFLSDIAKVNPEAAMNYQKEFAAQDKLTAEQQALRLQQQSQKFGLIANMAGAAVDQPSYDRVRMEAEQIGLTKPGELPVQYDQNLIKYYQARALTQKERIDQQMKDRDFLLKEKETNAQVGKLNAEAAKTRREASSGPGGLTEGEKAVDKDYAKDYNDFTGGGAAKAQDAINKLKFYQKQMANDRGLFQSGGGPIAGSLPDAFRTQASIAQRDNIVSAANSALKATFGGQLSDGERKALANEFYNDKLSNEENLKIIDRKITELQNGLSAQVAKAKHYEKNRTLKGFQLGGSQPSSGSAPAGRTFKTSEIEWAD